MGATELFDLVSQWGPMGLLVAYLIYQDQQRAKQRTLDKAERVAIDKETNEERRALTSALTTLSMVINGRAHG